MNKSLQLVLSLVVGFAAFLFFVLLFFPLDAVVGHYVSDLENQTKGNYRITYSRIEPSLVFESIFYDLALEQKSKETYQEIFYAPKVNLSVSLFSLLSQSLNTHFKANLKKGTLSGRIELTPATSVFDLNLKKVSIQDLGILKTWFASHSFSVDVGGEISGEIYASLGKSLEQTESDFRLNVTELQLKNFDIPQLGDSIAVPDLVLSQKDKPALLEGNLENGRLTLTNLELPGADWQLELKGRVNLGKNFSIVRSNLRGRFAFSDMVFEKIPALEIIKAYRASDDFFPLTIAGSMDKPQIKIGNLNLSDMLNF